MLVARLTPLTPRVFGGQAPHDTGFPYIVFKQVSGVPTGSTAGEKTDRWQLNLYFKGGYTAGRTFARSVIDALPDCGRYNGVCVFRGVSEGPTDQYDPDTETFFESVDYIVNYVEI